MIHPQKQLPVLPTRTSHTFWTKAGDSIKSFNNVLKHADAKHVLVRLQAAPATVDLTIQDDGVGFDATMPLPGERRGFGLLGIAERVRLLGGTCAFQSKPGADTTVSIHLPLPTPANTAS